MKKVYFITVILFMLFIIGCSKKEETKTNYIFKGENENWTGEFVVNNITTVTEKDNQRYYDSITKTNFKITYKHDEVDFGTVNDIEISYESDYGSGNQKTQSKEGIFLQKSYTANSTSNSKIIENLSDVVNVTVNIDGNVETFQLQLIK